MQFSVMRVICRLVAQKITVRTGIKISLIALFCFLSDGSVTALIGKPPLNFRNDIADPFVAEKKDPPSLQYESSNPRS